MKYINPLYNKLIDQINLGTQIAYLHKDYESTILGFKFFNRIDIETKNEIQESIHAYIKSTEPIEENIIAFSAFISYFNYEDILNSDNIEKIKLTIGKISNSKVYPLGRKALIAHLIKYKPDFEKVYSNLITSIHNHSMNLISEKGMNTSIIDAIFVLNSFDDSTLFEESIFFINNEIESSASESKLTTSKFGKIIYYLNEKSALKNSYVIRYEDKLGQELLSPKSPDLWFAISESDKLINSNLGSDIEQVVLDSLESNNSKWKDYIEKIKDGYITINLGSGIEIPKFSVLDDYINLIVLRKIGRDFSVQLSIKESESYSEFKSLDSEQLITDINSVNKLLIFGCILLILNSVIIFLLNGEDYIRYFNMFFTQKNNPKSIVSIIAYLSNPFVILGFSIWWFIKVYNIFKASKNLSIRNILISAPLIQRLIKFFK